MAKRTKLQVWTGDAFEDLFPETHISLINMDNGENLLHRISELETLTKETANNFDSFKDIVKGAQQAVSYSDYQTMIAALNALPSDKYKVGQNVMIVTLNVPDLWVSEVTNLFMPYTYTTDDEFIAALQSQGYVEVGFYKLSQLETGKVSLDYTKVTVNGVYQNIWDADTKLDKNTAVTGYPQAYIKAGNGSQTNYNVTSDVVNSAIVQRLSDGHILLPDTTYAEKWEAISVNQADLRYIIKPTTTSGYNRVIGVNSAGNQTIYDLMYPNYGYDENGAKTRYGIPFISNGNIGCAIPTSDYHTANKKYVDESVDGVKLYLHKGLSTDGGEMISFISNRPTPYTSLPYVKEMIRPLYLSTAPVLWCLQSGEYSYTIYAFIGGSIETATIEVTRFACEEYKNI